jgi:hypothetical protein
VYDPPGYLWAIIIAGPTAVAAATCIALYDGAERAGMRRGRAALLAGGAAVVTGGWLIASGVIASHGWYRTLPWFPVAAGGYLGLLLALRRLPAVARAQAAPGMLSRLELPHAPRVAGVAFLLYLASGHLPALFALPAGLGALTGFQLLTITPSSAPISQLPLALIPTATVPLLLALHITSTAALARAPRTLLPATAPVTATAR